NTDPGSVMFQDYIGPRSGVSAADVTQLLSLYDPRSPDAFEGATGNNTPGTATALSLAGGTTPAIDAELTSRADVHYSKVQVPSTGAFTVTARTSGISLLMARLTVFDSPGQVVATTQASDPRLGDLTVTVNGQAGNTYTTRVDGPTGDVFAIGAYRVAI